jgi:mannose-6-phosphate isomerase-like protein (cupin superfamily)
MRQLLCAAVAMTLAFAILSGQEYQPTCKMCPGTYIAKSEIDAYVKRAIANKLVDQQVRAVDVGKAHVGIGVVHRGRQVNPEPNIAEHDLVSELYHIIEGSATLVLGAELEGLERRPATAKTVRVQNGPGNNAKSMRDPVAYNLSAGDVVIIPAGTGHQFTRIDDHITYLMVRFDPDKIVGVKSEADSKADLRTSGIETPEEQRAEAAKFKHLEQHYEPSCRRCPGAHVPWSEVMAYVWRARANRFVDQQIRQVDIGKANVGVGVVYREKLASPEANVAEHDLVSEVYHVISGSATLKLGPDLVGKQRRPATQTTVRLLNGPGNNAKEIRNGVSYDIRPGDVVVIPAGTGHQFTRIDDHVTYLMVRIDPDKVTPHKTQADSIADLATEGRELAGGGAGAVATPATAR